MTEYGLDQEKWDGLLAEIDKQRGLLKVSHEKALAILMRGYEALYSTNILLYDRLQNGQKPIQGRGILNNAKIVLGEMERLNMQLSPEQRLDTSSAKDVLEQKLEEFGQL